MHQHQCLQHILAIILLLTLPHSTLAIETEIPPFAAHTSPLPDFLLPIEDAAKNGDTDAQTVLGGIYENGALVATNKTTSMYWYHLAIKKGHSGAIFRLALLLNANMSLLAQAAKSGHSGAQIYYAGFLQLKNMMADALFWLRQPAKQGSSVAIKMMYSICQSQPSLCSQEDHSINLSQPTLTQGIGKPSSITLPAFLLSIEKAAKNGDANAQTILGGIYENGAIVTLSNDTAIYWYRLAEKKGHPGAMFRLAVLLDNISLLKQAAESGHPSAQFFYGQWLLNHGNSGRENLPDSMSWIRVSAKRGNLTAAEHIYRLCKIPHSLCSAEDLSINLFNIYVEAANSGFPEFQHQLGIIYKYKDNTPAIPTDYEKSLYWLEKAASQGWAPSYLELGDMYRKGLGTSKNYEMAAFWYIKSSEEHVVPININPAFSRLGILYYNGQGVPQSYKKAAELFEKVNLFSLDEEPLCYLALMYKDGLGVKKAPAKAAELFNRTLALNNQNSHALYHLGLLQLEGLGIPKNTENGIQLLTYASGLGLEDAQISLGDLYAEGRIVKKDINQAIKWYSQAAEHGGEIAQIKLGKIYCYSRTDINAAEYWFDKAIIIGDANTAFSVADALDQGCGNSYDHKKAAQLYTHAAALGHLTAQNNLATLYYFGRGVQQSRIAAYALYNMSLSNFLSGESLVNNNPGFANSMSPDELNQAKILTRQLINHSGLFLQILNAQLLKEKESMKNPTQSHS